MKLYETMHFHQGLMSSVLADKTLLNFYFLVSYFLVCFGITVALTLLQLYHNSQLITGAGRIRMLFSGSFHLLLFIWPRLTHE